VFIFNVGYNSTKIYIKVNHNQIGNNKTQICADTDK